MFDRQPKEISSEDILKKQVEMQREGLAFQNIFDKEATLQPPNNERADLVKWQQDLQEDFDSFKHYIMREVQDNKGNWIPEVEPLVEDGKLVVDEENEPIMVHAKPMCNRLALHKFKFAINPYVSKNLMMSNYNEERILGRLRCTFITLIFHLGHHQNIYQIEEADLSLIVDAFKNVVMPTAFRCLNNGERNWLGTINKRIEAFTEHQEPKKKGVFGF